MKPPELIHWLSASYVDPTSDIVVWNWTYDGDSTAPQPAWHPQTVHRVTATKWRLEMELGPLDQAMPDDSPGPWGELPQLLREVRDTLDDCYNHLELLTEGDRLLLARLDAELAARGWAAEVKPAG